MKPRKLIVVVALLAVVLLVAGVTAADGPNRVNVNTLPLPIAAAYNGLGPDGNITAMLIVQQNPNRAPAAPALYGSADANDGGWFVSVRGNGIFAQGNNTGIWGQGNGFGGYFVNTGVGPGVYAQSSAAQGLLAINGSQTRQNTPAVQGQANAEDGGWFLSAVGNGLFATGTASGAWITGINQGILVNASNGNGINAQGSQDALFARGGADGIDTRTSSSNTSRSALFVRNEGAGPGITVDGPGGGGGNDGIRVTIQGNSSTSAIVARANGDNSNGIVGIARNGSSPYAIWGQGNDDWAGYFSGNVRITGSLDQGLAAVKMDDPRAPTERYINQASVVGGEMLTLYSGNATTDAKGEAVVKLPDYVEAIAKDFRYQLTPIGQFAQAIVAKELGGGEFVIRTDKPNVKVSWQVSGVRSDPSALASRYKTVEDKTGDAKGTYLNPQAFGQSKSLGVDAARIAALDAKIDASKAEYAAKDAAAAAKSGPDSTPRPDLQPAVQKLAAPNADAPTGIARPALGKSPQQ
ncbi:MAG: hypothetical protein U0641_03815 [Anaerolineae bacterium]